MNWTTAEHGATLSFSLARDRNVLKISQSLKPQGSQPTMRMRRAVRVGKAKNGTRRLTARRINLAAWSKSGTCFYLHDNELAGTQYGSGATCTATAATANTSWPGW